MRKIVMIVAILMIQFTGQALAAGIFFDGNDLYSQMTSEDGFERSGAIRYVQGAYDATILHVPTLSRQIPDDITAAQVRDIVKLYLAKHPEIRHRAAAGLVGDALSEAYVTKK
jgi:hypothetical protein